MVNFSTVRSLALASLLTAAMLFPATAAQAAQEVVITYGFLRHSIPVADLAEFAETGKQSPALGLLVGLSQQSPATLQTALKRTVPVNSLVIQGALQTSQGENALTELGQIIHPDNEAERVPALRTTLGNSALDGQLSLLKVMQNYPHDKMYVDGMKLVDAVQKARPLLESVGDRLETVESILSALGF